MVRSNHPTPWLYDFERLYTPTGPLEPRAANLANQLNGRNR